MASKQNFSALRKNMVSTQLKDRGIDNTAILNAFRTIPREKFVSDQYKEYAYDDRALPTTSGQTISQPYMVASMTQKLRPERGMKILEIGTGSGYQTAILAELGARIYTVEKYSELSKKAKKTLREIGQAENVNFRVGDGTLGWSEHSPYSRIIVTAGSPEIPLSLKDQLDSPGRMVIPIGSRDSQKLVVYKKDDNAEISRETSTSCVFVPLTGQQGWAENTD